MANDLAVQGGRALATGANPWAEAARGVETGTYLKFNGNDGRWSFGQDDEDLPEGSRVVTDMDSLAFGHICWVDGSVEEEVLVAVLDGKPPLEHELTDYGPYDEDDGWREAASLSMVLESYGDDDQDDAVGTALLWKTSTGGQVRQIRKLSGAYGRVFTQHPGEFPIVELGAEGYAPRNKKHGKKKFSPLLKIVGWMTAVELEGLSGAAVEDDGADDEPEQQAAPRRKREEPAEEAAPARGRGRQKADEEEPAPARGRGRQAEPEEEEDEQVEEAAPARGRGRRKAEPEAEAEEEDEPEAPAPRGRSRARDEENEDEGDEAPAPAPRGRSAARGTNRRLRTFD